MSNAYTIYRYVLRSYRTYRSHRIKGRTIPMSERQNTITKYVSDMLTVTKHIHEAIEKQRDDHDMQRDPDAYPVIRTLDSSLEHQISALEMHLATIGGDGGSPIKEAVGSVLGVFAGLLDKVRTDTVSKMLRDDYTALSLQAIALTMLHTTGLALKQPETANLALSQLHDLTPVIVAISDIIPLVVVRELTNDTEQIDLSVGTMAVRNTQQAWSREVTKA
jgi:hypothetical protein